MSEIAILKNFLNSIQVHVSDIWLESCVNWCKQEKVITSNYTIGDLQNKIYEQWLLTDLRDIEVRSLPPNLSTERHFTLTGKFCLQMMQVVDISKPKHWQLQKIRNNNALTRETQQDADIVGTGKRMLQLTLTDGVQEVEAMEFRPIPALSINLTPGAKIRIMGPVTVRRGRLMLEPHNVTVLHGEVEELLVTNAAENVLARFLKLPENPTPASIQEKLLEVEIKETNEGFSTNFKIDHKMNKTDNRNTFSDDDDLRIDKEIDDILAAEADLNQFQTKKDERETPDFLSQFRNNAATSTQIQRPELQDLDDADDVFADMDIDAYLNKIEFKSAVKHNIITIAKLNEMKKNVNEGNFKIKAKFKSVIEKLNVCENEYKLAVTVEDSSDEIIVKIHSNVVSEFAGYTPTDVMNLKKDILNKNESATAKMMNALQAVKDKLVSLDNIVSIQVEKDKMPVITKLL